MVEDRANIFERYLVAFRIIQPARVQDIAKAYSDIWNVDMDEATKDTIYKLHERMKADGSLVQVRRGTYVLDSRGMELAGDLLAKERVVDNARLYLMKAQRKKYRKVARRLG